MMHRTYQYRLKPNKTQKAALVAVLEQDRQLYNAALQERRDAYDKAGVSITVYDQQKALTVIRRDDEWFKNGHAVRQRGPLLRVDRAFKAFFRRVKAGEKPGYPRFKSRDRWNSVEIAEQYAVKNGRFHSKDFNGIRIHLHRPLPDGAKHCGATLTRDHKGWLVNLKLEIGEPPETVVVKSMLGLDVGLSAFVATSDGEFVPAPGNYRKAERELRRRQRALSRCKRGSNRRKKVKHRVIALHTKVTNTRKDFAHKLARDFARSSDLIAVEDLNIRGMVKNKHLSKSISDAGWEDFLSKLAYKAEEAGKHFVKVNPRNTSQHCSGCGATVKKSLAVRVHKCPECGLVVDRDVNAARNILAKAAVGKHGAGGGCHV
jgi:putative transposase